MMSGPEFLTNNQKQLHFGYGKRWESRKHNLAVFCGPSYIFGVQTLTDSIGVQPNLYKLPGFYVCFQGVAKLTYDIGLGIELFAEASAGPKLFGFKVIAFFSGAYRGLKKNFNPNVRSENPR